MKQLLTPMAIWLFGWTDELSIDCRMKTVYEKVGKAGGAGTDVDEWAIKGYLRDLAILPIKMELADITRRTEVFLKFIHSHRFSFHRPVLESAAVLRALYRFVDHSSIWFCCCGSFFFLCVRSFFSCFLFMQAPNSVHVWWQFRFSTCF